VRVESTGTGSGGTGSGGPGWPGGQSQHPRDVPHPYDAPHPHDTPRAGGTGRPGGPHRPALRPTSPATLVVAALVSAALGWLGISQFYGDLPILNWLPGVTLAGLAVVEFVLARSTRATIERKPRQGRVNPLLIARYAVLAKASSLAGAIFAGGYGGVAVWAAAERDRLRVADQNLGPAVAGLVGGVALLVAALLLERACRVPPPPDDHDNDGGGAGPSQRH
jgi:hypothetical protein